MEKLYYYPISSLKHRSNYNTVHWCRKRTLLCQSWGFMSRSAAKDRSSALSLVRVEPMQR